MSWREATRLPGKFRDATFFVEGAEFEGGRRGVVHEYPQRDVPYIEDMGRRSRSFPVEAFVIGDDYLRARDALIAALETPGAGELVHPYYGTRRVICITPFRIRESSADGGIARFGITFDETEVAPQFPTSVPAAGDALDASADEAYDAITAEYRVRYIVDNQPALALESLAAVVQSATDAMGDAFAPLMTVEQDLATLRRDLSDLTLDLDALVRAPADVVAGLSGVLASITSLTMAPRQAITALLAAYGFIPPERPPATTATRIREQANYDALLRLIRLLTVLQAARLAPEATYDTYEDAIAVRDALGEALDDQMDGAGDDSFTALEQLRADLVRAVPGDESDLPHLMRHTPAYQVPSLVLCHRLYGDLAHEADLLARNKIARPGFIAGGAELEVLSDVS
jgi:prophage DNA circulation protein